MPVCMGKRQMHSRQSDETDGAREERRRDRDRLRVKKKKNAPQTGQRVFQQTLLEQTQ